MRHILLPHVARITVQVPATKTMAQFERGAGNKLLGLMSCFSAKSNGIRCVIWCSFGAKSMENS